MMRDALCLRCPAKLNFGLEVVGRRSDGYHEIRTIFQAIDLADDLDIEPASSGLRLRVQGAGVPDGAENLVLQAAELLRSSTGVQAGARLALRKRIPPGAGLGGGSSDAAVTLMGLDELWGTRLGPQGLDALAGRLGADVPYFLRGGACLGLGRGDKLVALEWDLTAARVIVVCPQESLSTAQVYADWDAGLTSSSNHSKLRRFLASALAG
ncbi:MAG: 4-(cytidine 5'-diphospho)-2-C-methyl-D-erythritol kinase, partial [Acidobacteriota bacterium]